MVRLIEPLEETRTHYALVTEEVLCSLADWLAGPRDGGGPRGGGPIPSVRCTWPHTTLGIAAHRDCGSAARPMPLRRRAVFVWSRLMGPQTLAVVRTPADRLALRTF